MDVEIDDQHLLAASLVQAGPGRDHQIVEQAETAAKVPMGVVVAAGDLQPQPCSRAWRLAARVAPTERRVRSISRGDQGKPSRRMAASSRRPLEGGIHVVGIMNPRYLIAARGRASASG